MFEFLEVEQGFWFRSCIWPVCVLEVFLLMASEFLRISLIINVSTFDQKEGYDTIMAGYCVATEKDDRPVMSRRWSRRWRS